MVIFLQKGSKEIKKQFKPEELVFTVDDVICGAVGQAIEKYDKAVSFFMKMKSLLTINKDNTFSSVKTFRDLLFSSLPGIFNRHNSVSTK